MSDLPGVTDSDGPGYKSVKDFVLSVATFYTLVWVISLILHPIKYSSAWELASSLLEHLSRCHYLILRNLMP